MRENMQNRFIDKASLVLVEGILGEAAGVPIMTQTTDYGKLIEESIYVKIPASESNIWAEGDALRNPYREKEEEDYFDDLLLYIAAALVAVLFLEWWLQSRDAM